jgi:hypothetical protein
MCFVAVAHPKNERKNFIFIWYAPTDRAVKEFNYSFEIYVCQFLVSLVYW